MQARNLEAVLTAFEMNFIYYEFKLKPSCA